MSVPATLPPCPACGILVSPLAESCPGCGAALSFDEPEPVEAAQLVDDLEASRIRQHPDEPKPATPADVMAKLVEVEDKLDRVLLVVDKAAKRWGRFLG